jgi:hypothetical protein
MTIGLAAKWIYKNNGAKGFYRGVTPRYSIDTDLELDWVSGKRCAWYSVATWSRVTSTENKGNLPKPCLFAANRVDKVI